MNTNNANQTNIFHPENLLNAGADELRELLIKSWQEKNQRTIDFKLLRTLLLNYSKIEKTLRLQNEAQKRMLAIAAHDLSNPIVSIRGLADLVLSDDPSEPLSSHTETIAAIRSAAEGMQLLVNNLLELGALGSVDFSLALKPHLFHVIVQERSILLGTQILNKQMILHSEIAEIPPLLMDRGRIGQVVDNLMSNAIKFSPPGSTIQIKLSFDVAHAHFSVFDQGPGIAEKDRDKLFKSFQKLAATPTGGEKSTGLGLSIVKRIIDLHGGTIDVENRAEGGAVFHVKIPFTKSN
jgi:two-component system sensor histidine kinase/response regulator